MIRLYCLIVTTLLLTACGQSKAPNNRVEVAVNGIHGGALSNDGRLAIVGSVQHGGSLWRMSDGERLYNWNHSKDELSVIISADIDPSGNWALTAEAHTLVLWDLSSGNAARFWTAPGEVLDADLAAGGRYALLGQADHSAVIFNTIRGGVVRTFTHEARVRSVDLSGNGKLAITGSEDQTAVVWRVDNGERLLTIEHLEDVQQVAISDDGRYALTTAKYDRAEVWDIKQKKSLKTIPLSKERIKRGLEITAARFSEDGKELLLGYTNQKVERWQIQGMKLLDTWKLTKRHQWQPTGVSVVDLAFVKGTNRYYAIGSSGFIYLLQ
ncbi:MAG: WD40 repeat domain-containing protein [Cellvibrionaceae bacterium]